MTIAENVLELMKSEGINASELSRKTGIDRSVLHKILSGATKNPTMESIKALIQHYSYDEVVHGIKSASYLHNEIPVISWLEAVDFLTHQQLKKEYKTIKIGVDISKHAFALLIDHTVDSRFPEGTLLIVEPEKTAKHLSYVIVTEIGTTHSTLKRFIQDGSAFYLKPLDPSLPSVPFDLKKFRILGVVIQSIFDFE